MEYTIVKDKPESLHLARMPENFKMRLANDQSKDFNGPTNINRNLQVKKQRVNENDVKEGFQYIMEDLDDTKKTEDGSTQGTRYIGKEVVQNQKYLIFYKQEDKIKLWGLSSTISFKKDQQLRSSTIEGIKGRRGGRQIGIKALLRTTAKKEEEKEKERDKARDDKSDDDDLSQKSWSDSGDSDVGENGAKDKEKKKTKDAFVIKDIFEQEVPEPKIKPPPVKETAKESKTAKNAEKDASDQQSGDQKDSDGDSDSSFDFD